ncbi:hypothetical protein MNEG_8844 [Monoraphidium neglectum]|uniref:Uncharacterized protein n=1 Tax=Monoraphidium neglectum TaxID=145388 RepID=A0A0D2JIG1_9CHLO|nr:hypothetical protein MNEG_8844 [Monoraphidium neglectum]KIY99117.1 hypothetical protein MNEG_8844 [Monoraphidium neglectum]|eukprot:XP_013898137.1 hypothetical protein MNEG_8844 [Monoraphidium neglectum]
MCDDDHLEQLYAILFGPSPFSPVVKTLVAQDEPAALQQRGRASVMHKIESRFRFLSANSASTLRGKWPSYREALLLVRDRLGVQCSGNLSTEDLETELFLHILQNCQEYVDGQPQGASDAAAGRAAAAAGGVEGDGMGGTAGRGRPGWAERLLAPIRLSVQELLPGAVKLGGAVTVSAVGRRAAERLAAQRGLTGAAARYGALRGAMAFVGPVMWGWLAVDLGMMAIGTDYSRIIRAVFVLAQVRLLCTHGWCAAEPGGPEELGGGSVYDSGVI